MATPPDVFVAAGGIAGLTKDNCGTYSDAEG
jgi:hypothetical protein